MCVARLQLLRHLPAIMPYLRAVLLIKCVFGLLYDPVAYLLIFTLPGILSQYSSMQSLPFIRSFLAFQAELYIVACFYGYSILSERFVSFPGLTWLLWKDPGGLSWFFSTMPRNMGIYCALSVIRQFCFVLYIRFEAVEGEVVNNFVVDMWITFWHLYRWNVNNSGFSGLFCT